VPESAGPLDPGVLRDINEQLVLHTLEMEADRDAREALHAEVEHNAQRDALTGLPNRALLFERFAQASALASRHDQRLAVLFLDVDNFKQVNDSFGHAVGDCLLQHAAVCLAAATRTADTVSRHGGDEFVILLTDVAAPADAGVTAAKLLEALAVPFTHGEYLTRLTASIGISIYPDDGTTLQRLIERADQAMYAVKRGGSGGYALHYGVVAASEHEQLPSHGVKAHVADDSSAAYERRLDALREANEQLVLAVLSAQALQSHADEVRSRQSEFMAMLAHELRNPLGSIRNVASMLAGALQTAVPVPKLQAIIERQVTHMGRLVEDLLDVSRVSSGKLRLDRRKIDLLQSVSEAMDTCCPAMEVRNQLFVADLPVGPIRLSADHVRLVQVMSNLLDNASKYTPTGGAIRLTVTAAPGIVTLVVTDSGIGIPDESLPLIFDLFAQDPGANRFDGVGLGIGLTVVRELVEAHGGTVVARNAASGAGSEFVVTLPTAETLPQPR